MLNKSRTTRAAIPANITLRELSTFEEYQECVQIQRETWGDEFEELVPTAILKVSQKVGGIVAGAYSAKGRMLGFVYGLAGAKNGKPIHWSHMLAVRNEARGTGLGKQLKLYQREVLLARGVEEIYWTYDPLVARNANLNLNSLGADVEEYVKDMYLESSSSLHRGMSMDRFVVSWKIHGERAVQTLSGRTLFDAASFLDAPIVNTVGVPAAPVSANELKLPELSKARVEIPNNIEQLKSQSMDLAKAWRNNTRKTFLWYLEKAYQVAGFYVDEGTQRCYYCLSKSGKAKR